MIIATDFVVLLLLSGVTADHRMFAQRVVRGTAKMSATTDSLCPAYGCPGSTFFSALPKIRARRAVGWRRACLAAQLPMADQVGTRQRDDGSQRLAREIAKALQSMGTSLVLHFDVNKTLIMVDPAGRKTQSQVLNGVLAEICWGHVERAADAEQAPSWTRDGCPPSLEPPRSRNSSSSSEDSPAAPREKHIHDRGAAASGMMTYSEFLHQEFGDAEGKDNRRMKDARDERKGSFTEDGQPGADLRPNFLSLEKALSLPEAVAGSPLAEGAGLAGRKSYYVLPSFFSCLLALKEAGVDYGVVFRTFGDDIAEVSREHNAFCEGTHPVFPGMKMDGSDGRGDYRVHLGDGEDGSLTSSPSSSSSSSSSSGSSSGSSTVGSFYRDDEGVALVMGTLNNPTDRQQLRSMEEAGHGVYRSSGDAHRAICERVIDSPFPLPRPPAAEGEAADDAAAPPLASAAAALPPRSSSGDSANGNGQAESGRGSARGRCLALRDFYPFWRESLEVAAAGKILPVDLSQNPEVWPIMFDDNIGRADSSCGAHIVDVRDVATGQTVPFCAALRRYIVRAEPFLAIDQDAHVEPAAAAAAVSGGYNFFLLEVLKRLAPDRASSFVKSRNSTADDKRASAPQL